MPNVSTYINSFEVIFIKRCKVDIIVSIVDMKKTVVQEVKLLTENCTAGKGLGKGLNQDSELGFCI